MRIVLALLLLSSLAIFPQRKTDTLRYYFAINEVQSIRNDIRLDSLAKAITMNYDVAIYGFADFLSTVEYNLFLSSKRAEYVKERLYEKSPKGKLNFYLVNGLGEQFSTSTNIELGEPKYRRVDVYLEEVVSLTIRAERLEDFDSTLIIKKTITSSSLIPTLKKGEVIELEGLSFQPGRHVILNSSLPLVQKLLQALIEHPNLKIEIQGHVCCTDGGKDGMDLDTREMSLSTNRAKAIYDYLISKGISEERLQFKGFGRTRPKFPEEKNPIEEQANRRVEILILNN